MGRTWLVAVVSTGFALLGCKEERERDPLFDFPATGGAAVAGTGGVAGVGANYGGCAIDGLPAPAATAVPDDLIAPAPSDGCGEAYQCADVPRSVHTEGVKDKDCADQLDGKPRCGAWSLERRFTVKLPDAYDPQKPYGLLIEVTGCNGNASNLVQLNSNSLIRVGIAPAPHSIGYPLDLDDAVDCFDDREGDDSIEWEFYEQLYDKLNSELCFDRRRVFISADETGGALADQLACKYSGDTARPVRAMLANTESMDADAQYRPTCGQAPVAAMWIGKYGFSGAETFEQGKSSIARVMALAHCPGADYDHAQFESFGVSGGVPEDACQRIVGCDPLYPLITCRVARAWQSPLNDIMFVGFARYISLFEVPPLKALP